VLSPSNFVHGLIDSGGGGGAVGTTYAFNYVTLPNNISKAGSLEP
jgi:hypothetical protein